MRVWLRVCVWDGVRVQPSSRADSCALTEAALCVQGVVISVYAFQYAMSFTRELGDFDGKPSAGNARLAVRMAAEREAARRGAAGPGVDEDAPPTSAARAAAATDAR